MAPKRKASQKVIEVSISDSDSDVPPPAKKARSTRATAAESKSKAKSAGKGKGAKKDKEIITIDEEDEADSGLKADEALAHRLQAAEDDASSSKKAQQGSTSTAPRGRRGASAGSSSRASGSKSKPKVVQEPIILPAPPVPSDSKDPKCIILEYRKILLHSYKCGCGSWISEKHFESPEFKDGKAKHLFLEMGAVKCDSCEKTTCRGCGEADAGDEGTGRHCAGQRAVILFEVLNKLDAHYLQDHLRKPSASSSHPKGRKKKVSKPRGVGSGVGYGSGATHPSFHAGYGSYSLAEDENEYGSDDDEDFFDEHGFYPPGKAGVAANGAPAVPEVDTTKLNAVQQKDEENDEILTSALDIIHSLLPQPNSMNTAIYDFLPHAILSPLLQLSTLPDQVASLLRNDSVSEWTRRSKLYFGMLALLARLGESEGTLVELYGDRWEKKYSNGLGEWVEGKGDICWERKSAPAVVTDVKGKGKGKKRKSDADTEGQPNEDGEVILAPSLYTLLRRLVTQAEAFRKAATTGSFDGTDGDAELIGLCGDISTAGERCKGMLEVWEGMKKRAAGEMDGGEERKEEAEEEDQKEKGKGKGKTGKGKGKGKAVVEAPVRTYSDQDYTTACRALAYDSIDLSTPTSSSDPSSSNGRSFPTHYYSTSINQSASSNRPHGGFVHLAKELAVLSTSLPPGIFLRVDEARIDVIKCVIIGPSEGPYEGGLFEFDIFIPLQYPQVSPNVWLRTTGDNKVRFNPNLYAEGKVCLSILGTWPGSPEEMWQPNKSTILQVLISLQSMILGTQFPYYNEPGFGKPHDSKISRDYNSNIHLANVKHAMLGWCADDKKDGIWGDVIAMHFAFNGPSIVSTVKGWAAKDARMKAWTPIFNTMSGTHLLQPYHYPQYDRQGKVVDPPKADTENLVNSLVAALDKVKEWRTQEFLEGLLA
ncbi:hypothetical protein T439DRAFT_323329 [Meredithblackwellia eburnea MCA 4105]